jgi:hypothetical protein
MCGQPQPERRDRVVCRGAAGVIMQRPNRRYAPVMIAVVRPSAPLPWPDPWRDVEVVDAVLVDEAPRRASAPMPSPGDAGLYDASGRPLGAARFGGLVSVLA